MSKAVIFDMDGVLIDTERYLVKYWCQAAQEAGFPMKYEQACLLRSLAGPYAQSLVQKLFGTEFDYFAVRKRRKELMAQHIEACGIQKKAGVDETLDALHAQGYLTAVATATDEQRTERYLKQVGIYEKFDRIICATMVEHGKPKPDIYLYAAKQWACDVKDCFAIEDSPNGVQAAVSAGIPTIMVPDLTRPDAHTEQIVYAVADSLPEILAYVEPDNFKINGH